jgi:nitrogen fixation protein NifU and related proteins
LSYNERVLAHFYDPHNVGFMEDADGVGRLGDASCGDVFTMFIAVERNRIVDLKYLVQGCGAAVATCSALSDLARGLSIEEAMALTDDDISRELGGLPLEKLHCSNLAATVLHRAIEDYRRRNRVNLSDWRSMYRQKK